jgi:predicted RNA-binding Zn ribbon-like protein
VNFNSHTDAVVAVAVALVNVLTPGERRGRPYTPPAPSERRAAVAEALRAAGSRHGDVTEEQAAELVPVAHALREVFDAAAAGDVDTAAARVNRLLEDTRARPRLARHDGEPWHLHFHGTGGSFADEWAGPCATGLAVVLGSELHDRLGVCTAPGCDRVHVDTSRNGTRRYCSTACQNRVKTAAFRARSTPGRET